MLLFWTVEVINVTEDIISEGRVWELSWYDPPPPPFNTDFY